jgi:hypothetical protein
MPPSRRVGRAFHQLETTPSMASGRPLFVSMLALLVCDVIGGWIAFASGVHTWDRVWGFNAKTTVPLPIGVAQLVLAWLAARNVRPPSDESPLSY